MKKITKSYEVYEYKELSPDAQRKALNDWNEYNDMPFLQSMLNNMCNELIHEAGIKCTSNHPVCLYSLSNCQGDGLMFEGTFTWKSYSVNISHSGRYYHSKSKTIDIIENTDEGFQASEAVYNEFESKYQSICKKLEKYGYDWIEEETSEAHFIDECNENEWTFTKDGKMLNK